MQIRITTTDTDFSARYGTGLIGGDTVITVPDHAVEFLTFARVGMLRFDMAIVAAGRLPRDWANRWTMLPQTRIVV